MQRYKMTFEISQFAYDDDDAEYLAKLVHDRISSLMGRGQAIVRCAGLEVDTTTFPVEEDTHADEIALQAADDAEFVEQQGHEIAAENAWQYDGGW